MAPRTTSVADEVYRKRFTTFSASATWLGLCGVVFFNVFSLPVNPSWWSTRSLLFWGMTIMTIYIAYRSERAEAGTWLTLVMAAMTFTVLTSGIPLH